MLAACGASRPKACSLSVASRMAAADSGASSPWVPGTIQSSATVPREGRSVSAADQQWAQSALMKRSISAIGARWPSLEQDDCAWAGRCKRNAMASGVMNRMTATRNKPGRHGVGGANGDKAVKGLTTGFLNKRSMGQPRVPTIKECSQKSPRIPHSCTISTRNSAVPSPCPLSTH